MTGIVLCAVDVGQPDHEAPVLRRALLLAELDAARLDVITVIPSFGSSLVAGYFPADFHERAEEHGHRALEDLVVKTLGSEADKNVRHVVATGNVYDEVLKTAEATGAGLIVLGAHRPALSDYFIGPNASRIVSHARCSVYVVR